MAALRESTVPSDAIARAITNSDNSAAEELWASLGDPEAATVKVESVLRDAGDQTAVESRKVRPEFSAFGQTQWTLADEADFLAKAACDAGNAPVVNLMGQIASGQSWGLGTLSGAQFKGGWGPAPGGEYLVRQVGIVPTPVGHAVVAIAGSSASGSFADGTAVMDSVAQWIGAHQAELSVGRVLRATTHWRPWLRPNSSEPMGRIDIGRFVDLDATGLEIDQEQRDLDHPVRLEPVRAATTAKSAIEPSATGFLVPLSVPPEAASLIAFGEGLPVPSNSASVPITASPEAIFRQPLFASARRCPRSAALAAAGIETVDENGTGGIDAAHFFGDHAKLQMAGPRGANSSGITTPRKPISARPFHRSLS